MTDAADVVRVCIVRFGMNTHENNSAGYSPSEGSGELPNSIVDGTSHEVLAQLIR